MATPRYSVSSVPPDSTACSRKSITRITTATCTRVIFRSWKLSICSALRNLLSFPCTGAIKSRYRLTAITCKVLPIRSRSSNFRSFTARTLPWSVEEGRLKKVLNYLVQNTETGKVDQNGCRGCRKYRNKTRNRLLCNMRSISHSPQLYRKLDIIQK